MTKENSQDREWMVRHWAKFIREHPDKEWSKQQKELIDSLVS